MMDRYAAIHEGLCAVVLRLPAAVGLPRLGLALKRPEHAHAISGLMPQIMRDARR